MMSEWVMPRSVLFVPADRADLISKAIAGEADAICLDLEDGVAAVGKSAARLAIPAFLDAVREAGKLVMVRINAGSNNIGSNITGSNHTDHEDDIAALAKWNVPIVLPKAGPALHGATIQAIENIEAIANGGAGVIAMIEDLASLQRMLNAPGSRPASLVAIALGTEDLSADLGITPNSTMLTLALYDLVKLGRIWDVPVFGMPCSIANFTDLSAFEDAVHIAASLGVAGAFCIHPAQIGALNAGFAPSDAAVGWARSVVDCAVDIETNGVITHRETGQMLDVPVLAQAREILRRIR